MFSAYSRFIVHHSYLFLFLIALISSVLTIIPIICHAPPSFADPIVGFETRGTALAKRFIAWNNLIEETRPSKRLAADPKEIEDQRRYAETYKNRINKQDKTRSAAKHHNKKKGKGKKHKNSNITGVEKIWPDEPSKNYSRGHTHWGYGRNITFEDENIAVLKEYTKKQWVSLTDLQKNPNLLLYNNLASERCGSPQAANAHLVISSTDNSSLLSYENVKRMCIMQSRFMEMGGELYSSLCQRSSDFNDTCCPVWSVPNYIALISGKLSCENITDHDINKTMKVLKLCAEYFHNLTLLPSCDLHKCKVPKYCSQYDAVYNLFYYLIDSKVLTSPHYSNDHVENVMLFFPLAASSAVLPYYEQFQESSLFYENLYIPAIDFGLKNTLFDLWIVQDSWLVGLGGLFVFLGVWIYARSLCLTISLFIAITYSLGIAYFLYVYIFNLDFFPFMNLLVIVVVIGIGSDDAFLYVKIWKTISKQLVGDNVRQENGLDNSKTICSAGETILIQILDETLRHSTLAIFVTSLTTAVAFYSSYVSYIPAINCFSVFAGTAVLVNFILMVTWLPATVFVIDVKLCRSRSKKLDMLYKALYDMWNDINIMLNRFIVMCITKLYLVFVIVMGAVGIYSIIVVLYTPGLQLPESKQFQLFQSNHPFEEYDINYRNKFLFENFGGDLGVSIKMPLRWVWGVQELDNGNYMDPFSKGTLVFDDDFSISDPDSQMWMENFCYRLKSQTFYQPTFGPLLSNCFMENFHMFMKRPCIDLIDKVDRKPCCEASSFPFAKEVFDICIIKAMEALYQTSRKIFIPTVAGPKFLRSSSPPKVVVVVVEFESVVPYSMSFKEMNDFFVQVENWTNHELQSAPPGMRRGWFSSELQFYDLQATLASGTLLALILSSVLGFIVLLPATRNIIASICAVTAILFSSTVTIAILVLLGWKLNVLESIAISTSAGLAVDFSLHYALSYTKACGVNSARVNYCLSASAGPTAAAALTTGFAGIFLLRSNLLPYSQIGTFLAVIMTVSWVYATFFFCSLLLIVGSKSVKEPSIEERKSGSRVSSVCSGVPNIESHELEHLADSNITNITHSQSPSSLSATTVVIHDDCNHLQVLTAHETPRSREKMHLQCEND